MSNYSLVLRNTNQIIQFVYSKEEIFEVHSDLFWAEGPESIEDGKTEADYVYNNKQIKLKKITAPPYDIKRRVNYPSISEQLDALWHDMESEKIPGKKDSQWFDSINKIKQQYPKYIEKGLE